MARPCARARRKRPALARGALTALAVVTALALPTTAGASSYSDDVLAESSLSAYWRLGDSFGSTAVAAKGPNGTYSAGMPTLGAGSLLRSDTSNPAVDFDGTDDHMRVADGPATDLRSEITLEAWVRADATTSRQLITKAGAYQLHLDPNGRWYFGVRSGGQEQGVSAWAEPPVTSGQRVHIVATYDGSMQRLYADGALIGTSEATGQIDDVSAELHVGAWCCTGSWDGAIDEVAVYGDALSSSAIRRHFEIGDDGTPPVAPEGLSASADDGRVVLDWTSNPEADINRYDVLRATTAGGPYTTIASPAESKYVDATATNDTRYYYAVRAVDRAGHVGPRGSEVSATPRAGAYRNTVLDEPGLTGYWRLAETSGTTAGALRGPTGTYFGPPTLGVPGLLRSETDGAVDLDGATDYVRIPDGPVTDVGSAFTIEAWARVDATPPKVMQLITKPDAFQIHLTDTRRWYAGVWSGGVEEGLYDSEAPQVSAGDRAHVVLTSDGTTLRLYANGVLIDSDNSPGVTDNVAEALHLGSWSGGGSWDGVLDEMAIYDRALSASDVTRHFQIGDDGTPPAAPTQLEATAGDARVVLDWANNQESDLAGYDVFRATVTGGPYVQLNGAPVTASRFVDEHVVNEDRYFYVVKAVDRASNVSAASAEVQGAPSIPSAYRNGVTGEPSLQGYWRLSDPASDEAAAVSGPSGTYRHGALPGARGLLSEDSNTAVDFDGARHSVAIPDADSLDVTSRFSLEAWVRPDAIPSGSASRILTKTSTYWLGLDPQGRWWVGFAGSQGWKHLIASTGPAVGQTYHIVGTYDGDTLRLYVNGTQLASQAAKGNVIATANGLRIASRSDSEHFNGVIDEPAIYDDALSAAAVERHYENGASGTPPAAPVGLTAAASDERVTLDWTANTEPNLDGYDVYRATVSGGPYKKVNDTHLTGSAFVDKGRVNGQAYHYVVRAINTGGDVSADSAEASATPQEPRRYRETVAGRSSLAGYWRLDDASGDRAAAVKGPDATYNFNPRLGLASLLASDSNKAAGFGVERQNASVPDSPSWALSSAGSLEAWIKLDELPTNGRFAIGKDEAYHLGVAAGGYPEFNLDSGDSWWWARGPQPLVAGRTYHLVGTWDGTTQRLYVDGAQVASRTTTVATAATSFPLRLGARDHWWSFPGTVDEPAVYTTALSAAQVKEHYDLGSDGTGPPAPGGLGATGADGSVALDWSAVTADDLAGYDVFRATSAGGPYAKQNDAAVTLSAWTDTEVENGTTYYYVVRAVDRAGNRSAASSEARARPTGGPQLLEPDTVRSNGADLRWTRFERSEDGTFGSYEVHRAAGGGFTPSDATRIATITEPGVTTYRDTTAAPSRTFTYRVLTNGVSSGARTVTTPASGQARKSLQPRPAEARATDVRSGSCANRGGDGALRVGSTPEAVRGLVHFDLRDIPAGADVSAAELSLYLRTPPPAAMTVTAHRATAAWGEGSGRGDCGGGASWDFADDGIRWASGGGDFVGTASGQVAHGAADAPGWDSFDATGAVRAWSAGTAPNHGLLLKASTETDGTASAATYLSDDAAEASLRPKLTVSYADPTSKAVGPDVAVRAPGAGERLRGTRTIEVAASDDRRVEQVQFLVDGAVVGTDSTAPYAVDWNTSSVGNGTRRLSARATDDAGNDTTSPEVSVEVHNSDPATTKVTAPANRYEDTVKNDSPSAYWRLGETSGLVATDASGNGRNGTYSGTYLLNQTGLVTGDTDKAVTFRNATVDGTLTSTGFSGQLGSQVSAEAIVNYAALSKSGTHNRVISRGWGSSGGWLLSVYNASGIQRAYWAINKAGTVNVAEANVTAGRLHLAGTYDGTTMRLFVNGAEVATRAVSAAALNTTASVLVGQNVTGDITIDEAAVYGGTPPTAGSWLAHSDVGRGLTPTMKGTFTAKADASDDLGVERVEFFLGDDLVGEDTTSPYSAPVDTLSTISPVYDGDYTLTTKAHDTSGQVTVSSPVNLRVGNAQGTKYVAEYTSTAAPASVTFDDAPGATQEPQPLDVTVTNKSTFTWSAASTKLRPQWVAKDGTVTSAGSDVALSADVPANGQQTRRVTVTAPTLPEGVEQADYSLRVDLVDTAASVTFSGKGSKPLEHGVAVVRKARIEPGLERYYHYEGDELGAGMQHMVNVASGNSIVRWTPFESPGRGLSTVLDLTYNALDDKKKGSPVGNNWSLSMSSLTRFGEPLDVHPNKADDLAGRANRYVEFTDADGTTHRFTGNASGGWDRPPGVHLFLREHSTTDPRKKWALTKPDRVTFFYDAEGFPTEVEDRNGNRIVFTLEAVPNKEDPHGPAKRIVAVTDPAGNDSSPAANRKFQLAYYSKDEAKKPQIRGKVKRITDHNGSALDFEYYRDGNLRKLIQRGGPGTSSEIGQVPDRTFVFTYTTSSGSGPAIPASGDRVDPDEKTSNQSTKLFSVRDPLGRESTFSYLGPGAGRERWRLASIENRASERTTYSYDTTARTTTATAPLSRVTKYDYDSQGKVTSILDPIGERTGLTWTADRHVERVTEPSGRFTEYAYDQNGYVTLRRDQRGKNTTLEYDHPEPHLSQIRRKVDPKGNEPGADPNAHDWLFEHDAKGNLRFVTDPDGFRSERSYLTNGNVEWTKDENGNQTSFFDHDANGLPGRVTDAEGQTTRFGHDDDGLLRWIQDPVHASDGGSDASSYRSEMHYDAFHRMARQSAPLLTHGDRGKLIWTGAEFDANDNVKVEIGPHEGRGWTGIGAKTTHDYDAMDRPTLTTGPDVEADPNGERIKTEYDAAGRVARLLEPLAMLEGDSNDHVTEFDYDARDRIATKRRLGGTAGTQRTHYCYEAGTGDVKWIVPPRADASSGSCGGTTPPRYAQSFGYDEAHQLLSVTDAGHGAAGATKHTTHRTYDANGNVKTTTDQRGTTTEIDYNGRNLPVERRAPFNRATGRLLKTRYHYDAAGNRTKVVSPRAYDAGGPDATELATTTHYDKVNRPIRLDLPKSAGDPDQIYVHRRYDANGNLRAVSLPVTQAEGGDATLGNIGPDQKTTLTHFDTGWIRTENQPGTPQVRFAYTPEGRQETRTPETEDGDLRLDRQSTWEYWPDGMLRERTERDGGAISYEYDANNQLKVANDESGVRDAGRKPMDIRVDYDGLGRQSEVRQQEVGSSQWLVTKVTEYDLNGNLIERIDNREETTGGSTVRPGRRHRYEYDDTGWLTKQTDFGRKDGSDTDAHVDDRQIVTEYVETGWWRQRTISKRPQGAPPSSDLTAVKQRTTRDHFDNGKLKTLETRNGSGTVLESHDVSYADAAGRYVNGHRTKDVFTLRGPDTGAPCRDAGNPCTTHYEYNAREQLTKEHRVRPGHGEKTTTYDLLPTGDVDIEERVEEGLKIDNDYVGQQLTQRKAKRGEVEAIQKYEYDADGNLECAWEAANEGEDRSCATASDKLREQYDYDPLNRVRRVQRWRLQTGTKDDETTYVYDALDRVVRQTETHGDGSDPARDRTTDFTYLGTTRRVVEEVLDYAGDKPTRTKVFSYDAHGNRIAMSDKRGTGEEKDLTYAVNVQGSVSLLIDDAGEAKAQYGYTAYGEKDEKLTQEIDPSTSEVVEDEFGAEDPVNPYQYTQKRYDSGSQTLDMGARRFGPETGRFLQQDFYEDALGNLGLATDPLTANRYSLAGGNPVSFVEVDGHSVLDIEGIDGGSGGGSDGGGGGLNGIEGAEGTPQLRPVQDFAPRLKPVSEFGGAPRSSAPPLLPLSAFRGAPRSSAPPLLPLSDFGHTPPPEGLGEAFDAIGGLMDILRKINPSSAGDFALKWGGRMFSALGATASYKENRAEGDSIFKAGFKTAVGTVASGGAIAAVGAGCATLSSGIAIGFCAAGALAVGGMAGEVGETLADKAWENPVDALQIVTNPTGYAGREAVEAGMEAIDQSGIDDAIGEGASDVWDQVSPLVPRAW
ncbi:MAG: Ig-like domain-containing protein [Actinomycetota bacterium]|nr:Ig-like domain-containing protein [Actinomycetota bacterium]